MNKIFATMKSNIKITGLVILIGLLLSGGLSAQKVINIGTLPSGKQVTFWFKAGINQSLPNTLDSIAVQGTVSGSNFNAFVSDDPSTTKPNDSTKTKVVPCQESELLLAPMDDTVCQNSDALFFLSASGDSVAYQWYHDDGMLAGQSDSFLVISNVQQADSGWYYCRIKSCSDSITSDSAWLGVLPAPTVSIPALGPICYSNYGTHLTGATPAGGTWSGTGVYNSNLYPGMMGTGTWPVYYTYTGATSCAATDSVLVEILDQPDAEAGNDTSICAGECAQLMASGGDQYAWSSGDLTASTVVCPQTTTTYTVTVVGTNGCSATDDVTVTVLDLPIANAGTSHTICPGDCATLSASGGMGYLWSSGSDSATATVCPTLTTTYYVTVSNQNGCTAMDSVMVNVLPAMSNMAGNDTSICIGECTILTGSGGTSYFWSTGVQSQSITVCPSKTTTFSLTATDANGCTAIDDVKVSILPLPVAVVSNDTTICSGECTDLSVSGGIAYKWNTGQQGANINVCPTASTKYIITITGQNFCKNTASVRVDVIPSPIAEAGADQGICPGDTAILTASGGDTYLWSNDSSSQSIMVSPSSNTSYTVTVTATNGCTASDDVTVSILTPPTAEAGQDVTICELSCTTLSASGGHTYEWSTGQWGAAIEVCPVTQTTYTVTAYDTDGCSGTDDVTVFVLPAPSVDAGEDTTVVLGNSIQLNASLWAASGIASMYWTPGTHMDDPNSLQPGITVYEDITYTLHALDSNGCWNSDVVMVHAGGIMNSVTGTVLYEDETGFPLSGGTVILCDSNQVPVDTAMISWDGYFSFTGLEDGNYSLKTKLDGMISPGGFNSTDALLTLFQSVLQYEMSDLQKIAANVNADSIINSADALQIAQRYTNELPSFASGEWTPDGSSFYLENDTTVHLELFSLSYGDVNGTYDPLMLKSWKNVDLRNETISITQSKGRIPLYLNRDVEMAAASISLILPEGMIVNDIRPALEDMQNPQFAQSGNTLRISWYQSDAIDVSSNETFLYLNVEMKDPMGATLMFSESSENEFAGYEAEVLENVKIELPEVSVSTEASTMLSNYPNPFDNSTTISYHLTESSNTRIMIYNPLGKLITVLVDEFREAGTHELTFDASSLPAGIYTCKMEAEHTEGYSHDTRNMIIIK